MEKRDPLFSFMYPNVELEPGQPCDHPGCAAHVSHPCEGCGRYAAGTRNGPDLGAAWEKLLENRSQPLYNLITRSLERGLTREETLVELVRLLQIANSDLVEIVNKWARRIGVPKTWEDGTPAAEILDKHVFPELGLRDDWGRFRS
jgi:hypothetical protein